MRLFFQNYRKKRIWIGLYYLVLVLLISAWGNGNTSPNTVYKVAYCTCLLLPTLFNNTEYIPTLIVGFSGIALYGYAYSFMPTYLPIYLITLFVIYNVFVKHKHTKYKCPKVVLYFGIYCMGVDLLWGGEIANITYSILIIILMGRFIDKDVDWKTISMYSAGLALTTLVLSSYFIVFQDQFTEDYYAQGSGLERSGWMDPNYFGMVIGMGVVAAIVQLTKIKDLGILEKIFYITTVAIAIPTLVLNASRGSLLAVAVAFSVLLVFSKVKSIYKGLILMGVFGFVIYLYNNSYFDLLEYRILNDSGGGSGRSEIWERKIAAFTEGNIVEWLIGYGNIGGKELGMSSAFGSHNDFVAILCAYGVVGLLTFLSMLAYPVYNLKLQASNKAIVSAVTIYMFVVCLTLEPYTAGRLPYFSYLLYAFLIMVAANNQKL